MFENGTIQYGNFLTHIEDIIRRREDINARRFSNENIIFISSSYPVMFFLLYGQKSKQSSFFPELKGFKYVN